MKPQLKKTIDILVMLVITMTPVMNCHAGFMMPVSAHAVAVPGVSQAHEMPSQKDPGLVNHDPSSGSSHDGHHAGQCHSCSHCYMLVSVIGIQNTSLVHERLLNLPVHGVSIAVPVDIKPPIRIA